MITKQDPTQPKLWSRFQDLLSDVALEELDRGWQGVFHRMILQQLPVEIMEEKFNKYTGRPSKELYSVCGLLLIMNYFGWTLAQARLNYMVDLGVQYALNIEKDAVELSERTLHRYLDWLRKKDEELLGQLRKAAGESNGAHLASVAIVALADALADWWIFGDGSGADIPAKAWNRAAKMGISILKDQAETSGIDVNINATQAIVDWVLSNQVYFSDKSNGARYGFVEDGIAYIFPTILNQMLEKAGYSPRKTRKYLAEKGHILTSTNSEGKKIYTIQKWYGGKNAKYMAFDFTKASGLKLGEEAVDLPQNNHQEEMDGFTKESEKDNNPFTKYEQKPLPF